MLIDVAAVAELSSTRGKGRDCQTRESIERIPSRLWLHHTSCKRFILLVFMAALDCTIYACLSTTRIILQIVM
ncbi:unnamed protein product [Brugia timori]|uniref:Uncharacterized protein n=1 Tax=Brugia timori TaxID=42155 RepID=A0A0R3QJP2_9BILA|nr:unnamed protein product [Brugia timori]